MVLPRLDSTFGRVHTMIGWFNELPLTIFSSEISFERRHRLIVSYVEAWLVAFHFHVAEYLVEGFDDGGVGEVLDWDCVHVVRVVIIRHIITAIAHLAWQIPPVPDLSLSYKASLKTLFRFALFLFVIVVLATFSELIHRSFTLLSHFTVASASLQDSDSFISVIFSMTTGLIGVG